MQQNKMANIDPMRLAWLLRADLRRGEPASAPISDWFKMWWAIHGAREYPAWANHTARRSVGLFRPLPGWPVFNGFGMTPALRFLLETREDLARAFDVSSDSGLKQAIAWLFVHGLREHHMLTAIDDLTVASLDATPPSFQEESATGRPALTWLMFFVWQTSNDLRSNFNLQDPANRAAYLQWFLFEGIPNLKLWPLLAPRWREWLREPIAVDPASNTLIPRAGVLLWSRHEQLQRAFNLTTNTGIAGLALWTTEAWRTESALAWIDQPLDLPPVQTCVTADERPFGVNLIGFAFGELGIGEDVRMAVAACEAANIPFAVVNISPGDHLRQADQALLDHVTKANGQADEAPYAINIFCLTGFDTARVALERGDTLFKGRYNIGWWPWELPVWPRDWLGVFDLVDEVWAATSFTYRMYAEAAALASPTPTKVTLAPMAVSVDRVKPITRQSLGLPAKPFLFLYVFDFNSYLARKNPFAAVKAFRKAFGPADKSVGLVLKTMNSDSSNPEWQRFVRECKKDSRITLMSRTLERGEVLGLIQACNAYISLHRAEGFGRTLAEAMLFGKPVIGTDFSGNTDFLTEISGYPVAWERKKLSANDYPFVTDIDCAWWSEPDHQHAAKQMKRAKAKHTAEFSRSLIAFSRKRFNPSTVGTIMHNNLLLAAATKLSYVAPI